MTTPDGGENTEPGNKRVRNGVIALVIATALAMVAFVAMGDDTELETGAGSTTTTTTTTTSSTTTQAPEVVATSRQANSSLEPAANDEYLDASSSRRDLDRNNPGFSPESQRLLVPETTTTTTTTTTSTTTSTSPPTTAAPTNGPAPATISRPSCATSLSAATTRTAPFTGQSASIPGQMPAIVVKVSNNSAASRATLIGLDQADIVFEERIEASATRFFAIFHSSLPANVGPVRSGRTTDIQITQNLNRPVFAYSGSNPGVARQIQHAANNNLLVPFINTDRAPFARDSRWRAPDNLFVDPASLGGCGGKANPTAIFSYGSANSTTAQAASSVSLSARSPYQFDWNGSKWVRSQSGYAHVTRVGAALDPDNVVIMFAPTVQSQIDPASVDTQTIGSGAAWILRDGTITVGTWSRSKGHEPYTLKDGNGNATRLKSGQTWVVLAPPGTASFN